MDLSFIGKVHSHREYFCRVKRARLGHLSPSKIFFSTKTTISSGRSPGLVVMGGDSCLKVVGSNPSTVYWMDIFHIYL